LVFVSKLCITLLTRRGHANFLDVLVSELNISDDENEAASPVQDRTLAGPNEPAKDNVGGGHEELDGEELDDEDTASDSWSEYDDGSDDDDHALVRTVSGRPLSTDVGISARGGSNAASTKENGEDYFQLDHPKPTVIAVGDVLDLGEVEQHGGDYKTDTIVSVTVTSATLTPPTSPEEIVISHTS
jgi:hypothetical protein